MLRNPKMIPVSALFIYAMIIINIIIISSAYSSNKNLYWFLCFTLPILIVAVYNVRQRKHAVLRNYPLIGYFRYWFEAIRPELRQYFFESDLDGTPFNRRQRSIVYQRSKNEKQTVAFGMQTDPNQIGSEWVAHSVFPTKISDTDLRVTMGGKNCTQPYSCSILNVGAMSYGALSKTAIQSLNRGAKLGRFAHNTGEGGISDHHLMGGDLIWQIGTGYFGCRDEQGNFSETQFAKNATRPEVKMIELKISQGAKPGHGGILPASKNTPEIAAIRNVPVATTVYSPPGHTSFNDAQGLLLFIHKLRTLSGGKPVGFKLCIGNKTEFENICIAMQSLQIAPDFIVVDGAEGGTGAAPLEFTDNLGMPLHDALAFVNDTLKRYGLKSDIKLMAAGKIITAFDILKALSLGADACYSARGMMFSLGCIQALQCDSGKCPVGIATQNPKLYKGLDVQDKYVRVANFHKNTLHATAEMMEACGIQSCEEVNPALFFRKTSTTETKSFQEIYFNSTILETKLTEQLN